METEATDVAIIGAGPYGLSIAAHLRARGISFRVFGRPMSTWRDRMATGTFLKSFGFASSLYEPGGSFTIERFCRERGLPYSAVVDPVSIETFVQYGLEFQQRFVPSLEVVDITSLERVPVGFKLTTEDGSTLLARHVVVAAGITHFSYVPPVVAALPESMVTHSSEHRDLTRFAGRTVAVVGGGASAADLAGLLHEAGAFVHWIARRPEIDFHAPPVPEPRPFSERIRKPRSGLGQGWRAWICSEYPLLFHRMPVGFRLRAVASVNGPAPGWFARDRVVGHVSMHLGNEVDTAVVEGNQVVLQLKSTGIVGPRQAVRVDHIIAATGYRPSADRLSFLEEEIRNGLMRVGDAPAVDANFESSVPGLYLVGLASANNFGPLCRFAYGAKFTSQRLSRHLAAKVGAKRRAPEVAAPMEPAGYSI